MIKLGGNNMTTVKAEELTVEELARIGQREYMKQWKARPENKDKQKEYMKRYYAKLGKQSLKERG